MYVKKGRPAVARVNVECAKCHKPMVRRVSDMARLATGRVFCSKECGQSLGVRPRKGSVLKCELCDNAFYRQPRSKQRFCSTACQNASRTKPKVERVCEECGITFWLHESYTIINAARFCGRACAGKSTWKRPLERMYNGKPALMTITGYVRIWEPNHPAQQGGWVLEHRIVVENAIGRYLKTEEQVDHINQIKDDNRLENLQILSVSELTIKTLNDQKKKAARIAADLEELAEYRKRFGPLINYEPLRLVS